MSIVSAFHKIALYHPPVILGPTWLDGFPAIIPLAQAKKIALATPSAAVEAFATQYADWPVSFYFNTTIEAQTLVADLKRRKLSKKIAMIYEAEPYAELVRSLILKETSVNFDLGIQGGESDFKAILTRLRKQEPDVLIVLVWNESSLLSLLKQLKVFLPNLELSTIHDGETWVTHKTFAPYITKLIYSKYLISDKNFIKRFQKRFGSLPILTASNAYDTANAVFSGLNQGINIGEKMHEYLMNNEFDTVTFGKIKLNQNGGMPVSEVTVEEFVS